MQRVEDRAERTDQEPDRAGGGGLSSWGTEQGKGFLCILSDTSTPITININFRGGGQHRK